MPQGVLNPYIRQNDKNKGKFHYTKYMYRTQGSGPLYITHHKQVLAVMGVNQMEGKKKAMTVCYLNEKHKVM
jgi:hypothetical protein